jgi:DNA-directed RNA polymerase specialized sigma54-like protein
MRNSATQRAYQSEEMSLRMRRPPEEYVSLLSQNEQEFRSYVQSFEDNPLFNRLISEGVVHRVRLRGKIPRGKYEEFMDDLLLDFLKEYDIVSFEGWERDFLSPSALNRVPELSAKYKVPPGILLRHLRYLRSSERGNLPQRAMSLSSNVADDSRASDRAENSAAQGEMVDLTDTIEQTREFVERYSVSEQEFLDLILGGEATPDQLAERFGCSLREAEEVLEATDRVYLAESYEASGLPQTRKRGSGSAGLSGSDEPVAFVQMIEGQLSIQFDHDSIYTQRYRIKRDNKSDINLPAAARDLLTRARFINQRLSALSRLITTLCSQQTDYLETGDMRRLKPLAQAELARQLGEHPSTVSRLIRGKSIETPWGKMPLLFLCQSKTDVVARLIAEFPGLTDQEVVSRLREHYECYIARRTVAYHRGKRVRRNKRHKTGAAESDVPMMPRTPRGAKTKNATRGVGAGSNPTQPAAVNNAARVAGGGTQGHKS